MACFLHIKTQEAVINFFDFCHSPFNFENRLCNGNYNEEFAKEILFVPAKLIYVVLLLLNVVIWWKLLHEMAIEQHKH